MSSLALHWGNADWDSAVRALNARGTAVCLAQGRRDPVPVRARIEELARRYEAVEALAHPVAAHDLAVSYAEWCVRVLDAGV